MNFANFLPILRGQSVRDWQDTWLRSVVKDSSSILEIDNLDAISQRNERLSSYLSTLTTLIGSHTANLTEKRKAYREKFPPPSGSGVTAYNDREKLELDTLFNDLKFLGDLHDNLKTKISSSQTLINTKSRELGNSTR